MSILQEAKKAKFQPNIFLLLIIILGLFFCAYMLPQMVLGALLEGLHLSAQIEELSFLILNAITIFAGIFYCTKIEKRSMYSMGFTTKSIEKNYFIGFAIGLIFLSIIVGISLLLGAVEISTGNVTPMVILFFFGFVIQGMSEEVALRGCFMVSAANKAPIPVAILISSLFFAVPHYLFSDGQLLFTVNVLLMGILLSIYMLLTDNIWGASGLHTGFNFFARCLFNSNSDDNSVFFLTSGLPGKELIGGNSYGITSGLMWTICIITFMIIIVVKNKTRKTNCK